MLFLRAFVIHKFIDYIVLSRIETDHISASNIDFNIVKTTLIQQQVVIIL